MDRRYRRHSYRLFGAVMLLAVVVAIGVMLWTVFRTPSLPANWQLVRPGMNRLEVWRATHPGRASPGRELGGGIGDGHGAGGETQGKACQALFWQGEWQLHVIYGEDGRAEQVATRYIGPFSKRSRSWGSGPRGAEDGWSVQRRGVGPADE